MDSMRSLLSISDFLQVREHKLSNDLTVWLNEDHSQPKIFGAVVVKAGAKDSPNTGIAHYFEHMMFKGTDKIGTIDYDPSTNTFGAYNSDGTSKTFFKPKSKNYFNNQPGDLIETIYDN